MKTDLHIHSTFSIDSKATLEAIIKAAEKQEVDIIAITDHADFAIGDSCVEPDSYLTALNELQQLNPQIKILRGIELGLQFEHTRQCQDFMANQNFDFVIGSMHRALALDFHNGEYFSGRSIKESWQIYFEETLKAMHSFSDFDIFGHADIIRRYAQTRNSTIPEELMMLLDKVLCWLVDNGKGLELNSSGLRYGLDSMHPTVHILKRFRDLGGEIVTIGSDSHTDATIGHSFSEACGILSDCGFRYLAWFENRVPKFAGLEKNNYA